MRAYWFRINDYEFEDVCRRGVGRGDANEISNFVKIE
jgi:hypothetical protein